MELSFVHSNQVRIEMPALVRRRSIQDADNLALTVDLQNSASNCVSHVDEMIRRNEEAILVA